MTICLPDITAFALKLHVVSRVRANDARCWAVSVKLIARIILCFCLLRIARSTQYNNGNGNGNGSIRGKERGGIKLPRVQAGRYQ